jgi:hypothetical protein
MGKTKTEHTNAPAFPYADLPSVVRRLLAEIPKRPKPSKLNETTATSWGLPKGGNTRSAIGVLKKIGLISDAGEPLEPYAAFMQPVTGPKVLAALIRHHYRKLFDASHSPQTDSSEALQSLFNIHSGGSTSVLAKQIQTFKALCEYADFTGTAATPKPGTGSAGAGGSTSMDDAPELPPIKIDLHIHLPENKTTRDYEAIIQDIARYIYGRKELGNERP